MNPDEYAKMYAVEDTHWWFVGKRRLVRVLLEQLPTQPSRQILDVGCGTGGIHALLRSCGSVCGVDASEQALALAARRRLAELKQAVLPNLPFEDGSFDLVTLFDVLYHRGVADDQQALAGVWRVLRPGGLLVLTDSAFGFLRSAHDTALHGARRYTVSQMRDKLQRARFRIIRLSYANFFIFLPVACWRLARRRADPAEGSDVHAVPAWLNAVMGLVYRVEAGLFSRINLPFGTSIIGLAQK